ncbi:hypothetical protein [Ideonella livida]|uniref:Uncharacterized protein n=1 Tax=Ideonella livida TaxID=2707176 RepID=A0A7C9TL13_9BURK|nr:hypothetical protein [Ideonella livida]NDY93061.1 hypothetical protein [Ideonella livida]
MLVRVLWGLALAWLVWRLLKAVGRRGRAEEPGGPSTAPGVGMPQTLVPCARCGRLLPPSEAVADGAVWVCASAQPCTPPADPR